jgi:DNA-directed RNA polymerase subunit RPC12/RpoP
MGKRLPCPRCGAASEYDVPPNEAMAPQREVKCRPCGHRFVYGFAPEYVTEADREPEEPRAPTAYDLAAEVVIAREHLTRHVMQDRHYADRDRDVLLLHLLDMADHLDEELGSIKRVLDVIVKRGPSR